MKIPSDFPDLLLERLRKSYTSEEFRAVIKAFSEKRITSLRVNRLKGSPDQVLQELTENKIGYSRVNWYPEALIADASARRLTELTGYHEGRFYIQSLSSMIPVLIMDPQKNEKILDLTAAPGSKTTQIASITGNTGEIVANDTSQIRTEKLKANLAIQGVTNVTVTHLPGQAFWGKYPESFDRVLLDTPCSMEGRINFNLPKSYYHWSAGKVRELAHLQKWLIRSAVSSLKVGGRLVYSTCTLAVEENEMVIDWILRKEDGKIRVLEIPGNLPLSPAFTESYNLKFPDQVKNCRRIMPSFQFEGFFVAVLEKTASNIGTV